ncbi:MAG TPA: chloride channel protein [Trueperaceae bacterium]|nr:chloride channel protein [Trueperaceae bacterium]
MWRAAARRRSPRSGSGGGAGASYLAKWALIGLAVGVVAGLGAALFHLALDEATRLLLVGVGGHQPPLPPGEGGTPASEGRPHLLLPLVVAGGALVSGLLVARFAPEAEGAGTDAALEAVHARAGKLRRRVPLVKVVASALTVGSGGSAGREGPASLVSAGLASAVADWLGLSAQDRRVAVTAGMGAGIGAIFSAPLGGALMAAEVLYQDDMETEAIVPSMIASIVAYSVFGAFHGFAPLFGAQTGVGIDSPLQLPYYALLGLACGAMGALYAAVFSRARGVFARLDLPAWLRPAVGGLGVGLMGLALPQVLHTGYGWLPLDAGSPLLASPVWLLLLLPFAKVVATALSVGSGGSGGTFGPGMAIGGLVGAAFWRLGHGVLPNVPDSPAPFVIVGMMALFGGIAHVPIAMMLMVAEMTGSLSLLPGAMVAVAVATALVGERSVYRAQLPNRASAPAHRVRMAFPLLSSLVVRDALRPVVAVEPDASPAEARAAAGEDGAVVVGSDRVVGVVTAQALAAPRTAGTVGALAKAVAPLGPDLPLDQALEELDAAGLPWLPVVEGGRLVGRVSTRGIVATYKETLGRGVRRVTDLPPETALLEAVVDARSPLAGLSLAEARLPAGVLVLSLLRDGTVVYPRGDTIVAAGDRLTVLAARGREDEVRRYLTG